MVKREVFVEKLGNGERRMVKEEDEAKRIGLRGKLGNRGTGEGRC